MKKYRRLAEYFIQTRIMGRRIPLLASFKITYRCNLSCRGCPFHRHPEARSMHMSWDEALSSLDTLHSMGCPIVIFEGGEPLLWRDDTHTFLDLVNVARKKFICIGATTNGTVALDVPTDILWVSIDGTKETHDELRNGSFDQVISNIRSSAHKKLLVHFTINIKNWNDLEELVKILAYMKQVKGITVQLFYPYNQGEETLTLSKKERTEALMKVVELKKRGYPIINSRWGLLSMINNTWKCHDRLLANVDPDGSISTGCYVSGRGDIQCSECGFTPVAEASGAYDLVPGALYAGWRLFLSR